ncbi:MAG: hypothetical protein E6K49_16315 [Gammaproteobacteria bacterium]|nr:MAG: hypothetical protein E6K49_16315 [Gammaproteobacteria bacterium]
MHRLLRLIADASVVAGPWAAAASRVSRRSSLSWVALALSACIASPSDDRPKEYLDEATAATVSVVGRPLVFAHERPELTSHARDYVTLAAAAVNRNGKVDHVLIAYFWSTVDDRAKPTGAPVTDPLVIAADDRRLRLTLQGHSTLDVGIGVPVHAPPGHDAAPNVYRTDLGTLRFIAEARHLAVLTSADDTPMTYEVWEDQRAALLGLVRLLSGQK